ncbi:hypothetical protein QQZ08_010594 [Neonectria magnoliae]|uniref:FHA domain-containing protein n=1 Tax=Neonectria magnoliae TaxID=2732573 RepID=A0ABR1HGS6_9HYPO
MEDTDLIACLYSHKDDLNLVSNAFKESSRYVSPRVQVFKNNRPGERGSPQPREDLDASDHDYLPRLEIRFSDIPRTERGVVFGSNLNCDVALPYDGVSDYHLSLTFDDMNRPLVEDLGSSTGTEVTYDDKKHSWIVSGHWVPQQMKCIVINVTDTISFQIVFARYNIGSQAYIDKVNRFRQGIATA